MLKKKLDFIDEAFDKYKEYILPRVNKNVNLETILSGAVNYRLKLGLISPEQSASYYENLLECNNKYESKVFPYIYDPNNPTEAYLEAKSL